MEAFRLHLQKNGFWYFAGLLWFLWVVMTPLTTDLTFWQSLTVVSVIFAASGIMLWGFSRLFNWVHKPPFWDEGEKK